MLSFLKKCTVLLALLLCLLTVAAANSIPTDSVWRVSIDLPYGETVTGSAFCFDDNTLLFPIGVLSGAEGVHVYDLRGNELTIRNYQMLTEHFVLLEMDPQTPLTPWVTEDVDVFRGAVTAVTATETGMAVSSAEILRSVSLDGLDYQLVSCSQPLLPGAMLVDDENRLVAIVTGTWTESDDTYAALSLRELTKTADTDAGTAGSWTDEYTVELEGTILTVEMDASIQAESSTAVVLVNRIGNPYHDYVVIDSQSDHGAAYFSVVPGEQYDVCVWLSADGNLPASTENAPVRTLTALATREHFSEYGYTETSRYFGVLAADVDPYTTDLPTPVDVTEAVLQSDAQKLFLHVTSVYEVSETVRCTLTVTLETPEGWLFDSVGGFIFDAAYAADDSWNVDVSALLSDYAAYADGYASGEYTVSYFFDNTLAGTLTFTLD